MLEPGNNDDLPPIPGKRYFTIGEVSELCAVKPHVLRYWEQEFPQLKPVKRRGNRRYYQRQDVLIIRQIRSLLVRRGLHDRRRSPEAHGRRSPHRHEPEPADHSPSPRRARGRPEAAAPLGASPAGYPARAPAFIATLATSVGAWRSLVAHLHGVQGVAGSNPVAPTNWSHVDGRSPHVVGRSSLGHQRSRKNPRVAAAFDVRSRCSRRSVYFAAGISTRCGR